jgi:geranylgeranyl pyrophosphate synthase
MDIYSQVVEDFCGIPAVNVWPELQELFCRVALGRPGHWLLPLRACEAVGGGTEQAFPAVLAVACSHIGIVLVDDMLDADPRGEHLKVGQPAVANMASALQSAALGVISHCGIAADAKLLAMESVNEMFLATTIGQYWDVNSIVVDEDSYWKIAKAKSSPFFGVSLQVGALMGGTSVEVSMRLKELGSLYGEMIQIHDDLGDTLAVPARPDWGADRSPLPILFAQLVDHPQRTRFEEIRPKAETSPEALKEAQDILIQCGAVSYCFHQLLMRYETAKEILAGLTLTRCEILEKVFADVVQPVFQLFEEVDNIATPVDQVDVE